MLHWLHHLFSPHCPECMLEKECKNCDVLRQLLEVEKFENKQLLDKILGTNVKQQEVPQQEPKPILPRSIASLRVRREMMEANDRLEAEVLEKKAEELKKKEEEIIPKSIEELEKELGVANDS